MKQIIIYSSSDYAQRIYQYIQIEKSFDVLAFCVHKNFLNKKEVGGLPVCSFEELSDRFNMHSVELLIAIGYSKMNNIRKEVFFECKKLGYKVTNFISKFSLVQTENIGEGNIILPNVYVGVNCSLGNCNIFAANSCVAHDSNIGDFNFISSNVAIGGGASVLNNCFLGLSSTIKDGVIIEDYSLLGQATNVLYTTDKYGVYVGNPAKKIKENSLESKI